MRPSKHRRSDRAGRPPMRSPGRPPVARREHRQRFWRAIGSGVSSEEAGVAAGVSPAVGSRWFRESGGWGMMCPDCYRRHSTGRLGLGRGQYLLRSAEVPPAVREAAARARAYWQSLL